MLHEALVALLKVLGARPETPLVDALAGDGVLGLWLRRHFQDVIMSETHPSVLAELRLAPDSSELWDWAAKKSAWLVTRPLTRSTSTPADHLGGLALLATLVHQAVILRHLNAVFILPRGFDIARELQVAGIRLDLPNVEVHVAPLHSNGYSLLCWMPSRSSSVHKIIVGEQPLRQCLASPWGFGQAFSVLLEREFTLPPLSSFSSSFVLPTSSTTPTPSPFPSSPSAAIISRPESQRPPAKRISVFPKGVFGGKKSREVHQIDECPPEREERKKPRKESKRAVTFAQPPQPRDISFDEVVALYAQPGDWIERKRGEEGGEEEEEEGDDRMDLDRARSEVEDVAQLLVSLTGAH